jgi:putative ABC transport system permease protein
MAATGALRTFLFGVSPLDPLTFSAVTALMLAIALLACSVPARRATRADPLDALREE